MRDISGPAWEKALLLQGVATSIDALSVGFTNEQMDLAAAFCLCSHYCGSNICGLCGRGNDRQEIRSEAGG